LRTDTFRSGGPATACVLDSVSTFMNPPSLAAGAAERPL
jgi:hypothetical protein